MSTTPRRSGPPASQKLAAIGLLAVIALLVGGSLLYASVRQTTPDSDSPEAGFLRDMQVHHTQAVTMSMILRDRTGDEGLLAMTTDIAFAQQSQIGTMAGFIHVWDINPTGDGQFMSWMGHPTTGLMPGMATPEEIALLESLPLDQSETLFLQLMTRHHVAGVDMAQTMVDITDNDDVEWLAESMVRVQTAEIGLMNEMLTDRGAETITSQDQVITVAGTPGATPADHDGMDMGGEGTPSTDDGTDMGGEATPITDDGTDMGEMEGMDMGDMDMNDGAESTPGS